MSHNNSYFEIHSTHNGFIQPWCTSNKPYLMRFESQYFFEGIQTCMVCGTCNGDVARIDLISHFNYGANLCIFHCSSKECKKAIDGLYTNDFMYADGLLPQNTPLKVIMPDGEVKENFSLLPFPIEFNGNRCVIVRDKTLLSTMIVPLKDIVDFNQDKVNL